MRLIASLVPATTTQTLARGTIVPYSLTTTAVTGYKNLYLLTCTATWPASGTSGRTDAMTLSTYAVSI